MSESRTKLLLGALGFLLVVLVWKYAGPSLGFGGGGGGGEVFEGGAPPAALGRIPGAGREAGPPVEEVVELRVAELQGEPGEYQPGRDPWRFAEPPPPPPPPPPRGPTPEELQARREAEERMRLERERLMAEQATEASKPKPPPFTFRYLGRFGPGDRPIAVFTDGKDIFNVQEGDVIQGQFIVDQIGFESVDIRFVGFPDWPAQRLAAGR